MPRKYCAEAVADLHLAVRSCCGSCHTDEDDFGYELLTMAADNGEEYYVCCAVMDAHDHARLTASTGRTEGRDNGGE